MLSIKSTPFHGYHYLIGLTIVKLQTHRRIVDLYLFHRRVNVAEIVSLLPHATGTSFCLQHKKRPEFPVPLHYIIAHKGFQT